jgi:YidC/Oxa1 family membrane protein insertase
MSDPSLLDDISTIPEKMGYLKEIGLDFGWGPSSLIETFLEAFHIYGGLPWWGSAVATAVLIRVAMVPIMYKGNQMTIRMKEAKDVTEPLRQRMLEAFRTDPSQAMVLKGELDAVKRTYGIQAKWMFLPLLQIPLGIGGFRVMRAMADLPVPSLESESVLWLYDVTMADPYYVLPVALAVVTWRTITVRHSICKHHAAWFLASIFSNLDSQSPI